MDAVFLALRVLVALGAVLALLWWMQQRVVRGRGIRPSRSKPVTVVGRQGVGGKASVAVVEMDGTRFLLGVTESSITVLHTADAPEPEPEPEPVAAALRVPSPSALAFERAAGSILSPATWSQTVKALRQAK